MNCGEEIRVKDVYGSVAMRIVAQCHDRYLLITNQLDWRNGLMLAQWPDVLRELVAMTMPAALTERAKTVEGAPGGMYVNFPLTYPLSVKGLADLLSVDVAEVRERLSNLAVSVD